MNENSKEDIRREVDNFFKNIQNKTPQDIKKIKKLAMSKNIPLKEKRKLFCKKCLSPYHNPKIRIKNRTKSVTCSCGYISRWKI